MRIYCKRVIGSSLKLVKLLDKEHRIIRSGSSSLLVTEGSFRQDLNSDLAYCRQLPALHYVKYKLA